MSNNLLSIGEYAKLCGLSRTAIYNRIISGEIIPQPVQIGSIAVAVIDVDAYPPVKGKKRGRKTASEYLKNKSQ